MQFDQRTLRLIGLVAVALVVGLVQWLRSGPDEAAPPAHPTASDQQAAPASQNNAAPREGTAPQSGDAVSMATHLPVAPGEFDYYVLVLSWSPTYCAGQHGGGDEQQCRSGRPYGFVLHGLWPQNEHGYPQNCDSNEPREVSEANMARALKVSPSKDLVQHEWEKHGTCSGLSPDDFFASAIAAYASVKVPSADKLSTEPRQTTPDEVREAFLKENPSLMPENLSATCSRNELAEVWVCLDKSLKPRACSAEVRKRHCGARHVRMRAVRGDWP